jgi:hypothetical protein
MRNEAAGTELKTVEDAMLDTAHRLREEFEAAINGHQAVMKLTSGLDLVSLCEQVIENQKRQAKEIAGLKRQLQARA